MSAREEAVMLRDYLPYTQFELEGIRQSVLERAHVPDKHRSECALFQGISGCTCGLVSDARWLVTIEAARRAGAKGMRERAAKIADAKHTTSDPAYLAGRQDAAAKIRALALEDDHADDE